MPRGANTYLQCPKAGAAASIGKIPIQDFITDTGNTDLGTPRDIVFVTSEATANYCAGQVRHLSFTGRHRRREPQSIATYQVSAASGRFCDRGGRFRPHATNEEFGGPFYQKLVFTSQFNAGVRVTDVRDPYNLRRLLLHSRVNANTESALRPFQGNPNKMRPGVQTKQRRPVTTAASSTSWTAPIAALHVLPADWRGSENSPAQRRRRLARPPGDRSFKAPIPMSSPPFSKQSVKEDHMKAFATHCTSAVHRARRDRPLDLQRLRPARGKDG